MRHETQITQEMLDAVGEPIEKAFTLDSIKGLVFFETGGLVGVYHLALKQALRKRWQDENIATAYLVKRGILELNN